jgi:hypothetical protein
VKRTRRRTFGYFLGFAGSFVRTLWIQFSTTRMSDGPAAS